MKTRRLVIALVSVVIMLTMASTLILLHGYSSVGHAQEAGNQQELGITGTMGFLVESVEPGSAAEQVGLMPGDVIMSVNKRRVQSTQDMRNSLRSSLNNSGAPVEVVFLRYDPAISQLVNRVVMVTPIVNRGEAQTAVRTETVSGGVLNDKAIEKPLPTYPEIARAARAE
jgi:membrane-associated protease RseP (regulator of RpoE activity)